MSILLNQNLPKVTSLEKTIDVISYVVISKSLRKKETVFNMQSKRKNVHKWQWFLLFLFASGARTYRCSWFRTHFWTVEDFLLSTSSYRDILIIYIICTLYTYVGLFQKRGKQEKDPHVGFRRRNVKSMGRFIKKLSKQTQNKDVRWAGAK